VPAPEEQLVNSSAKIDAAEIPKEASDAVNTAAPAPAAVVSLVTMPLKLVSLLHALCLQIMANNF